MSEKQYKIISDNLGEYSVLTQDNIIVCTEIQDKTIAELFCDELNEQDEQIKELEAENEKLKQEIDSLRRQLTVYRKIKRLMKDND